MANRGNSGTKNLTKETLIERIVKQNKLLSQQSTKIKQMETEQKSMMLEAQTLRAKIADLNALISELKGKIEEQKAHEKQVVSAYEQQTDKLIAERNRLRREIKQYKERYEFEKNEVKKGNTMLEKAWKERDYYKEELHKRGKDVIDIDSVLEKIEEEEANRKRWGVALKKALRSTLTPKKLLIKVIQEMEEIEK